MLGPPRCWDPPVSQGELGVRNPGIATTGVRIPRDGEIAEWAREKGAGLGSAELLPGARLVRAFNAIGAERMGSAYREPGRVGMPIVGDDAEAVEVASRLIRELGYEPVLIGDLAMGRYLVPGPAPRARRRACPAGPRLSRPSPKIWPKR